MKKYTFVKISNSNVKIIINASSDKIAMDSLLSTTTNTNDYRLSSNDYGESDDEAFRYLWNQQN